MTNWTSLLPLVDLKYNHTYNYFISFKILKEISISIAPISSHFNSHYDELFFDKRRHEGILGGDRNDLYLSVVVVTQLYQLIKTNLCEDLYLCFSPYVNFTSINFTL